LPNQPLRKRKYALHMKPFYSSREWILILFSWWEMLWVLNKYIENLMYGCGTLPHPSISQFFFIINSLIAMSIPRY
jgi:hypothetical protein